MKAKSALFAILAVLVCLLLAGPVMAQYKRPSKARGNVGLMNLDKNYMILVTPKGKLITIEFTDKTKVTELVPQKAETTDIDVGASASVTYITNGDKKSLKSIKFEPRRKKKKKKK